jgi:uncharacterized protein
MQINVAQLLKEPVGANRTYRFDEHPENVPEIKIKGEAQLTRTNRGILVIGDCTATVPGTCSRCLKDMLADITFHMEDEYFPLTDINGGPRLEIEPGDFTIGDDNILDLAEAIRQYLIMSIPVKMLCSRGCPGLCQVCGHDLSLGNCGHQQKQVDSRWEKLVQLEKESIV